MTPERLTEGEYWESGYAGQSVSKPLVIDDFRQLSSRRVTEKIVSLGLPGRSVLEVGAGNSAVLSYLAARHGAQTSFSGLDYSERGCRMLERRAELEGAKIAVYQQDLFAPAGELLGKFELLYSLGVAEHFSSLPEVLQAMASLLAPDGRMLTIIPNMAGVLGRLTLRYNRAVFELHVPHDLLSLLRGHQDANLIVEESGYLCSSNFGVLSSCFSSETDPGWRTYKWLSRLSKLLWFFESRVGDLPHTARLSPYIYVVSRAKR